MATNDFLLVSPAWRAAILIRAKQELKALQLEELTTDAILAHFGVSRSRAYKLCQSFPYVLPSRGPGRPKKSEDKTNSANRGFWWEISNQVRDFMVYHPGSMLYSGKRLRYSDEFRNFVVELMQAEKAARDLTREEFAKASGIPVHTLNSWFYTGPKKLRESTEAPAPKPPNTDSTSECASSWEREYDTVITLWDAWKGNLSDFCTMVKQQGIALSRARIEQVLFVSGRRSRKPRKRHRIDSEAVRGALERFFPNAQVAADGKYVELVLNGERYRFCWQLVTDVATGGHLGFSVEDEENSRGLIDALDQAKETAGEVPLAALRDNRKCNVSKAVEEQLEKDNILSMTSKKGRPQTNGTTEGSFSLFEQSMPEISLNEDNPREQARNIIRYILTAFCSGRNMTPRKNMDSKTPAVAFQEKKTDEEEREEVRKELEKLEKRARRARRRPDCRKEQPVVRELMTELLSQLGVTSPRKGTIDKLAIFGIDASTEASGILLAKLDNGLKPDGDVERYLLGIATQLANRNEDFASFEHTVKLRERAGELILDSLKQENTRLLKTLSTTDYIKATAEKALEADSRIDRHFWWNKTIAYLSGVTASHRLAQARQLARKVATRYSLHYRERDLLIGQLAKVATPIPGDM
jgi:hypothetical protein